MRKLSAAVLAGALMIGLAACGNGSDSSSSSSATSSASASATATETPIAAASESGDQTVVSTVKVKQNDGGKKEPTVTFTKNSDAATAGAKVINEGSGDAVKAGYYITLNIEKLDASTGKAVDGNDYTSSTQVEFKQSVFSGIDDVYAALQKTNVGGDVAYYIPAATLGTDTGQVWVFHVAAQEAPPTKASAAETTKLKDAGKLPTVKFADDGTPTVTIPKNTDAPKQLVVDTIKEGTGTAATEDSTVTVKYLGVKWSDGETFDSSYANTASASASASASATTDPQEVSFSLSGVISGWTQGLEGVKAGSTVVLSIPSVMAYGDDATNGASGPLVFVVEVIAVS